MSATPLRYLGDLPIEEFLRDYWQQKPVFIKNALKNWQAPLDGNDLAGLALEDTVESRLVIEKTSANPLASQWQMEHGPLAEERFETLPESHFTLLIQALDQMCPEVHELLHQFRFIPNWRLDDVMASVAPKGGSVGPHFDYYDVFLLQATGSRHWQLGQICNAQTPMQEDCPLKILTEFDTQAQYLAEPGDLLYIPANVAHWGVSQSDDCTTYSIGFRAPSYSDILLDLSQEIASSLTNDLRYRDQANSFGANPGEIPQTVIDDITQRCQAFFTPSKVSTWLGKSLTEAKRNTPDVLTGDIETTAPVLSSHVRAAYIVESHANLSSDKPTVATIFINGEQWAVSLTLAQAICSYTKIRPSDYAPADQAAINEWIDNDYLYLPESADASSYD